MVENKKILVCVTFREFNGDENDRIQRLFLESVKEQTYKNYKIIATVYREKNVESVLNEYGFDYIIHKCSIEDGYTHSWSEVITNSFEHLKKGENVIYWTQADTIIDKNFFKQINDNFEQGYGGTSLPVLYYDSIKSYNDGNLVANESLYMNVDLDRNPYNNIFHKLFLKKVSKKSFLCLDPNLWVNECAFVDGDIFFDIKNNKLFKEHKIKGAYQGLTHNLMFTMFSKKLINLYFKSKAYQIKNDFGDNDKWWHELENKPFFKQQLANVETLNRFIDNKGLNKNYKLEDGTSLFIKLNIAQKFKVLGKKIHKIIFTYYLLIWRINYIFYAKSKFTKMPLSKKLSKIKHLLQKQK